MIRAVMMRLSISMLLMGMGASSFAGSPELVAAQSNTAPEVYTLSSGGRSYLGVDIQDVTGDRVAALKLKEERGVEVTMVDQDAPAGKAGIKEHDVILQFNGTPVESEEQLRRMLRETPPGRNITLGISRDGNPMNITLQLADRGKIATAVRPKVVIPQVRIPEVDIPGFAIQMQTYSSVLGAQTENLSRQLGEYFGVKDGEGVLVRSVEKGSAAEKAGLRAGDVVVRADNEKLSDRSDLSHILRSHREGGKLSLTIVRDKREQTIVVDLPNRGSDDSFQWFPSDDFRSGWNDFREEMRNYIDKDVNKEIDSAMRQAMAKARVALEQAQVQLRTAKPQMEATIREARAKARAAQRIMEEQRRELRRSFNNMI